MRRDARGFTYRFKTDESIELLAGVLRVVTESEAGITRHDVADALGISNDTAHTYLTELRVRGKAHPLRKGKGRATWHAGPEAEPAPRYKSRIDAYVEQPAQATVTTWEPHNKRDPLIALLFGDK